MFVRDQDFVCEDKQGILRCLPKTPEATSAFKTLQITAQRLGAQLPGTPEIHIDGTLGPSSVLAVQLLATRLGTRYPAFLDFAGAQPEQAIPYAAAHALELAGALDEITTADPQALMPIDLAPVAEADPMASLKSLLTGERIAAVGVSLLGLVGLGYVAHASDQRALGTVDRSQFLPESDGSNEFDDDYEDEDSGDDGAPEPEPAPAPEPEPTAEGEPQHAA